METKDSVADVCRELQLGIPSKEGQKIPASPQAIIFYQMLVLIDLFNRHERSKYTQNQIEQERQKYIKENLENIEGSLQKYTRVN